MKSNACLSCFLATLTALLVFLSCSDEATEKSSFSEKNTESKILSRAADSSYQVLEDGSQYIGEMVSGAPHGHGKKTFPNGDIYDGQFKKGFRHGHGTHRYKADSILERFIGMWANDEWDGYGKLVLKDGSRIVGKWNRNQLEYGDFQGADGEVRSGKWYGDWEKLEEGFFKNIHGLEFSGVLKADGSYDSGFLKNPNGDSYTGSFQDNIYHGRGVLEKGDGTIYVGGFFKNNFEGTGTLKEPDGRLYSGEFKDGLPDGYGIQEDPSGVRYMGYWSKGLRNGMGTIDFGDGTNFTGQFSNGLAIDGQYDWGDGRITNTSQDENGNWIDR